MLCKGGPTPQQHVRGKTNGQKASDPYAHCHRGHVLHLLDAAVFRQHLESI